MATRVLEISVGTFLCEMAHGVHLQELVRERVARFIRQQGAKPETLLIKPVSGITTELPPQTILLAQQAFAEAIAP